MRIFSVVLDMVIFGFLYAATVHGDVFSERIATAYFWMLGIGGILMAIFSKSENWGSTMKTKWYSVLRIII